MRGVKIGKNVWIAKVAYIDELLSKDAKVG